MDTSYKKDYYCDGICESCVYGRHYNFNKKKYPDSLGYYTCDPKKISGLNVKAPMSPNWK